LVNCLACSVRSYGVRAEVAGSRLVRSS